MSVGIRMVASLAEGGNACENTLVIYRLPLGSWLGVHDAAFSRPGDAQ